MSTERKRRKKNGSAWKSLDVYVAVAAFYIIGWSVAFFVPWVMLELEPGTLEGCILAPGVVELVCTAWIKQDKRKYENPIKKKSSGINLDVYVVSALLYVLTWDVIFYASWLILHMEPSVLEACILAPGPIEFICSAWIQTGKIKANADEEAPSLVEGTEESYYEGEETN